MTGAALSSIFSILVLSAFILYTQRHRMRNWARRRRLGYGAKPHVPFRQPWKPSYIKPWYRNEGNLLAVIASVVAFAFAVLIRFLTTHHLF